MKTLIIIPAYNEGKSIQRVIRELNNQDINFHCLVVNDGSSDDTQQQAEACELATVIQLPNNLGIGGAVQTGFKYAARHDFDFAIQFDGDGQHLASEIEKILMPVQSGECDLCIGSRFIKKTDGFQSTTMRRLGIKILALFTKQLIHQKIFDSTSGFRAYNKKTIQFLAQYYPTDFPEPESIILLGRTGFTIKEIATDMRDRAEGSSSISGLKSAHYMMKVMLSMFMTAWRTKRRNIIKKNHNLKET